MTLHTDGGESEPVFVKLEPLAFELHCKRIITHGAIDRIDLHTIKVSRVLRALTMKYVEY